MSSRMLSRKELLVMKENKMKKLVEEYGDKSHHLGFVFALWSTKQGVTEKDLREATEAKEQAVKQLLEELLRKIKN